MKLTSKELESIDDLTFLKLLKSDYIKEAEDKEKENGENKKVLTAFKKIVLTDAEKTKLSSCGIYSFRKYIMIKAEKE